MPNNQLSTVVTFLYLLSLVLISDALSKDDLGAIERLAVLAQLENEAEQQEADDAAYLSNKQNVDNSAFLGDVGRAYRPYTLVDILNTKVKNEKDLCSRDSVRQFLVSGSLQALIKCKLSLAQRRNNTFQDQQTEPEVAGTQRVPKVIESYSGKLLKRLFANGMSRYTPGISSRSSIDDVEDGIKGQEAPEKRARLSINGALGSLVDMLHHESRQHRRPVYAFHRELLHLG